MVVMRMITMVMMIMMNEYVNNDDDIENFNDGTNGQDDETDRQNVDDK